MPEHVTPPYMLPQEVAKLLHVNRRTVTIWYHAGKLRGVTLPGGHIRIETESVRELGVKLP